jgi:hypothetical protein
VRRGDAEEHPAAEGGAVGIEAAVPGFQAEARAGRGAGLTFVSRRSVIEAAAGLLLGLLLLALFLQRLLRRLLR